MKKFKLALFLTFSIMIILQLFFGRDFSQLKDAATKYRHKGDFGQLMQDVSRIFAGGKINLGGIASEQLKQRLIYVWTDDQGVVHNSETKPKTGDFKVIKMGDNLINTQKGLTDEEIKQRLKANP